MIGARWSALVGAVVVAGVAAACGGGAGECPGDRSACEGQLELRWRLLTGEFEGFEESCGGVGATHVDLVVEGLTPMASRFACGAGQTLLSSMASGEYVARVTLLAVDEAAGIETALTTGSASTQFTWDQRDQQVTVEIPLADFDDAYAGSWYYRVRWAGLETCAAAGVATYDLRLERDGAVIGTTTTDGIPLDGSARGACEDFTEEYPPAANGVPWGPAMATVRGYDAEGARIYQATLPTFVGAGANNPEMILDVEGEAPMPDAAPPDAAPDAALPDGGVPDATPI